jgi:multiple sugar transport system substrate-binding protein
MNSITRRTLFAGSAGAAALAAWPSLAQAKTLTALGHRVHQTSATTGPGGDATEAWRKQAGASVNWVTFGDVNAIHERLLREATLGETSIDVAYLLNGRAVPRNLKLFEPLDALLKDSAIEALDDFAPG